MTTEHGAEPPQIISLETFLNYPFNPANGQGISAWLRALPIGVPTLLPNHFAIRARGNRGTAVHNAARSARVQVKIRTINGALYVMRGPLKPQDE